MKIEQIKNDMKNMGYSDNHIEDTLCIIRFIGMYQDVAWDTGEGVNQKDIAISNYLLKYLLQGYITDSPPNPTHKVNASVKVYALDQDGEEVFNEMKEKIEEDIILIEKELTNGYRLFSIRNPSNIIQVSEENNNIILNSKRGKELKKAQEDNERELIKLLKKYKIYFEATRFNSVAPSREYYHYYPSINHKILEQVSDYQLRFEDTITNLNNTIVFYNKLLLSADDPKERKAQIICSNLTELKNIIEKLSEDKITTPFNDSSPYYFRIIPNKESEFKKRIEEMKQTYIDETTNPIIDFLLNEQNKGKMQKPIEFGRIKMSQPLGKMPDVIEGEISEPITGSKPKMICPVHQKISSGYLKIENSRPILICGNGGNCNKPFEINWDKFVFDTTVLANGLFSDLYNIDFFKGKTILIPETVTDEVSNWKNPEHKKHGQYKIAIEELKKIRYAHDQGKLVFQKIGTDPTYKQLIEKGRPDKIIAGDSKKQNAIVITSDKDFFIIDPDVSVINYQYYPPRKGEIIEVNIVEEYKSDGIGYYKNYRISIAGAGNKIGNKVTAEITEVVLDKPAASGKIVGK